MLNIFEESIESCMSYIPKFVDGINKLNHYFYHNEIQKGINLLPAVIEGLKWLANSMGELHKAGYLESNILEQVTNQLPRMASAIEKENFILVADILAYGIRPVLCKWNRASDELQITGVIFSKDRPMQLDATLRSFFLHCLDPHRIQLQVLYLSSNSLLESQYRELMDYYPYVNFIKETCFKPQLLASINSYSEILFMVDDNLFVNDFSIENIRLILNEHINSIGFSLRLGINTTYCYSLKSIQKLPDFEVINETYLKYDWTTSQYDFAYPLEVSSSLYRSADILPILEVLEFTNPNTLEAQLASNVNAFIQNKKYILCMESSITFCNPINIVQNEFQNRSGEIIHYTVDQLTDLFKKGYRINVGQYSSFVPKACHQEIKLEFFKLHDFATEQTTTNNNSNVQSNNQFRHLGENVIIDQGCHITSLNQISIGDNVYIGPNGYIAGDGGLQIGKGTMIGPMVYIQTSNHNYDSLDLKAIPYDNRIIKDPIKIDDYVWIGGRVTLLPGVTIGEGAVIGAGSVVKKDIPPLAIAAGNPAKIIKYRNSEIFTNLKERGMDYFTLLKNNNLDVVFLSKEDQNH